MGLRINQHGFILVVVLWIVALLAIMAAAFSRSVQSTVREASASARVASAEAIVDGGASLVLHDFAEQTSRTRRRFGDGVSVGCRFADSGTLVVRVSDAAGRVNLNAADANLVAALLAGSGLPGDDALRVAQRIVDFRDRDSLTITGDNEQTAPPNAPGSPGIKNAPFDTMLELGQVRGVTPGLIAAIAPHVTLLSGTGKLDERVTSPMLIALLNAGLQKLPLSTAMQASLAGDRLPAEFVTQSTGQFHEVLISALLDGGAAAMVRGAVVDLQSPSSPRPKFVAWTSEQEDLIPPVIESADLPPC